jgi:hypothetical protein
MEQLGGGPVRNGANKWGLTGVAEEVWIDAVLEKLTGFLKTEPDLNYY